MPFGGNFGNSPVDLGFRYPSDDPVIPNYFYFSPTYQTVQQPAGVGYTGPSAGANAAPEQAFDTEGFLGDLGNIFSSLSRAQFNNDRSILKDQAARERERLQQLKQDRMNQRQTQGLATPFFDRLFRPELPNRSPTLPATSIGPTTAQSAPWSTAPHPLISREAQDFLNRLFGRQ